MPSRHRSIPRDEKAAETLHSLSKTIAKLSGALISTKELSEHVLRLIHAEHIRDVARRRRSHFLPCLSGGSSYYHQLNAQRSTVLSLATPLAIVFASPALRQASTL